MQRAMGFTGLWTIDGGRASLEALPPLDYLGSSYYRRWFLGLESSSVAARPRRRGRDRRRPFVARGIEPAAQTDRGRCRENHDPRRLRAPDQPTGALQGRRPGAHQKHQPARRTPACRAMPAPRSGWSRRSAAAMCFPTPPRSAPGEHPQWLYTVVFSARELWGEDADPTVKVSIEAFEPYLDPA